MSETLVTTLPFFSLDVSLVFVYYTHIGRKFYSNSAVSCNVFKIIFHYYTFRATIRIKERIVLMCENIIGNYDVMSQYTKENSTPIEHIVPAPSPVTQSHPIGAPAHEM